MISLQFEEIKRFTIQGIVYDEVSYAQDSFLTGIAIASKNLPTGWL